MSKVLCIIYILYNIVLIIKLSKVLYFYDSHSLQLPFFIELRVNCFGGLSYLWTDGRLSCWWEL